MSFSLFTPPNTLRFAPLVGLFALLDCGSHGATVITAANPGDGSAANTGASATAGASNGSNGASTSNGGGSVGGNSGGDATATTGTAGTTGAAPDGSAGPMTLPCASDKVCTPARQLCDPTRFVCVDCLTSADCAGKGECQSGACVPVTACTSSLQCPTDQVCETNTASAHAGTCVQCVGNPDCSTPGTVCIANQCKASCASDKDCRTVNQLCITGGGNCVDCNTLADCGAGRYCANNLCLSQVCTPGTRACRDATIATCNAEGSGFGAPTACAVGLQCIASGGNASCANVDAGASTTGATTTGATNGGTTTGATTTSTTTTTGATTTGSATTATGTTGRSTSGSTGTATTGTTGGGSCAPSVWLAITRSGSMFDLRTDAGATYWSYLLDAFTSSGGLLDRFAPNMRLGLVAYTGESPRTGTQCPLVTTVAPAVNNAAAIRTALMGVTRPVKGETPTGIVIRSITAQILADPTPGPKYIVIISNGLSDFCDDGLAACPADDALTAVQAAWDAGIGTRVVSLGTTYAEYQQEIANAGLGMPVALPTVNLDPHVVCGGTGYTAAGKYAPAGTTVINAPFPVATTSVDLGTGVASTLQALTCP